MERGSLWERPDHGSRGPAGRYSRPQVAAAAVSVADERGLPAVTMRSVAGAVGTGSASLYRYVLSRDEILELMSDHVVGEIDFPQVTGDWSADMLALAHRVEELHLRHRWLLDMPAPGPSLGPNALRYLDHALAALAPSPATGSAKLEAIGILNALVPVLIRQGFSTAPQDTGPDWQRTAGQHLATASASGAYPRIAEAMADARPVPSGAEPLFDRLITRTLAGLLGPEDSAPQ